MAKKVKTFSLEGRDKEFTIEEMTVGEIIDFVSGKFQVFNADGEKDNEKESNKGKSFFSEVDESVQVMDKVLDVCCNFTSKDLKELAPSEIKVIYGEFKEVNADFFDILKEVGLLEILEEIKTTVLNNFSRIAVTSLRQVT